MTAVGKPTWMLACGLLLEAALLGMLWVGDFRVRMPAFLGCYAVAFVAYLAALKPPAAAPGAAAGESRVVWLVIVAALLFRVTLWSGEPSLSDDIYRYLWDGQVLAHGINPYRYVPAAEALSGLRDDHYLQINHRDFGTPYGPLSQLLFVLGSLASASVVGMKALYLLFDLMSIGLLAWLLALTGRPQRWLAIYAWNPLVLVEVASSGHNDSQAIFLLLLALALLAAGRRSLAAVALAAAVLSKYFALLAVVPIWQRLRWRDRWLFVIVLAAGFAPFHAALESHLLGLLAVGADWEFNASLYALIALCCGSGAVAKGVSLGLFLLVLALVWRSHWPVSRSVMTALAAALLLTTTLQPWYLLWIAPLLVLHPNRAWLLLTGLAMLAYLPYYLQLTGGTWQEPLWLKLVVYLPFYALLLADWRRARRTAGTAPLTDRG